MGDQPCSCGHPLDLEKLAKLIKKFGVFQQPLGPTSQPVPLTVEIQDENGIAESAAVVWDAPLDLIAADESEFACLRFIDPNGDTIFNQIQLPWLLADLCRLRARCASALQIEPIAQLDQVVECAIGKPHIYVRFIGD